MKIMEKMTHPDTCEHDGDDETRENHPTSPPDHPDLHPLFIHSQFVS
jgi:hypothetical protein